MNFRAFCVGYFHVTVSEYREESLQGRVFFPVLFMANMTLCFDCPQSELKTSVMLNSLRLVAKLTMHFRFTCTTGGRCSAYNRAAIHHKETPDPHGQLQFSNAKPVEQGLKEKKKTGTNAYIFHFPALSLQHSIEILVLVRLVVHDHRRSLQPSTSQGCMSVSSHHSRIRHRQSSK